MEGMGSNWLETVKKSVKEVGMISQGAGKEPVEGKGDLLSSL